MIQGRNRGRHCWCAGLRRWTHRPAHRSAHRPTAFRAASFRTAETRRSPSLRVLDSHRVEPSDTSADGASMSETESARKPRPGAEARTSASHAATAPTPSHPLRKRRPERGTRWRSYHGTEGRCAMGRGRGLLAVAHPARRLARGVPGRRRPSDRPPPRTLPPTARTPGEEPLSGEFDALRWYDTQAPRARGMRGTSRSGNRCSRRGRVTRRRITGTGRRTRRTGRAGCWSSRRGNRRRPGGTRTDPGASATGTARMLAADGGVTAHTAGSSADAGGLQGTAVCRSSFGQVSQRRDVG